MKLVVESKNRMNESASKYYYDDAVGYLEEHGISCDPTDSVGEYVCDLLDEYISYDRYDDEFYKKSDLNKIVKLAKSYVPDEDYNESFSRRNKLQESKNRMNESDSYENASFNAKKFSDIYEEILHANGDLYEIDQILEIYDPEGEKLTFEIFDLASKEDQQKLMKLIDSSFNKMRTKINRSTIFDLIDECSEFADNDDWYNLSLKAKELSDKAKKLL